MITENLLLIGIYRLGVRTSGRRRAGSRLEMGLPCGTSRWCPGLNVASSIMRCFGENMRFTLDGSVTKLRYTLQIGKVLPLAFGDLSRGVLGVSRVVIGLLVHTASSEDILRFH